MKNKEFKLFNIALIAGSINDTKIQYYAKDEEDCKDLFIKNNPDLDETDIWVKEIEGE